MKHVEDILSEIDELIVTAEIDLHNLGDGVLSVSQAATVYRAQLETLRSLKEWILEC